MPKTTRIESRLLARIDSFVEEISAIVREAAVEAVHEALIEDGRAAVPRRGNAAGRKKVRRKTTKTAARKKAASGRRVRRSAADLEKLGARFLAHVKSHPGQRLEEIGKALRIDTADLKRPVTLLMEAKKLRTEGQKRGTKYFAGGAGRRKAAKRKVAKRKGAKRKAARKRATRKVTKKWATPK